LGQESEVTCSECMPRFEKALLLHIVKVVRSRVAVT
jgi:hypothetical protein